MSEGVLEKAKNVGLPVEKTSFSTKLSKFRELGLLVFIVLLSVIIQIRSPRVSPYSNNAYK